MSKDLFFAIVLNLHQPAGNLEHLLEHEEWMAKEILWALDRIPRSLWGREDVARVHLAMSGTLLETLSNAEFQRRVYGIVKCGDLLWHLRNPAIELLGTGYYHPVLPLTPVADRDEHVARWLGIGRHLFDRPFAGFWPPEMGFCMEMIPLLRKYGYRYVLVDSRHVEPVDAMRWEEVRYRPHIARYGKDEIVVVVRDRELSDAQESGMDAGWFYHELCERTKWCDAPALVTTCTDGDNGGWFRNTRAESNFWGGFYHPFLDGIHRGEYRARPILISEYLDRYGPAGEVKIREGAWNTGWHHGVGFVQWTGSQEQKDTLRRVGEVSRLLHEELDRARRRPAPEGVLRALSEAQWRLLRAETSCNFFWGQEWVGRTHADLDQSLEYIRQAKEGG